jgi:hypothetical protein
MRVRGCDYHPGFQQIAFVDTETGELQERRLPHPEEAEKFYRELAAQGMKLRVGMEASGMFRQLAPLPRYPSPAIRSDQSVSCLARVRRQEPFRANSPVGKRPHLSANVGCWAMMNSSPHPSHRRMPISWNSAAFSRL